MLRSVEKFHKSLLRSPSAEIDLSRVVKEFGLATAHREQPNLNDTITLCPFRQTPPHNPQIFEK